MKTLIITTLIASILSACTHADGRPMTAQEIFTKENMGAAVGAVGGAWAGSNVGKGKGNIAAIAVGTLLGGYMGKSVGASLDKADKAYHGQTYQHALEKNPSGQVSTWENPDSGNSGRIMPTRTVQRGDEFCREFTQTIIIGGQEEQAFGLACRQPDGSWKIQQ